MTEEQLRRQRRLRAPTMQSLKATQQSWDGPLDFTSLYHAWFHHVCRWARAIGTADGEVEDVAQEVFVAVQRRLPEFRNDNLAGWLYRITRRAARDHRHRAWFRHLVGLRRGDEIDTYQRLGPGTAEELSDRRLLEHLMKKLSDKKSRIVSLYELEGYTGDEIAELEHITVDTVWSRLRHARLEMKEELKCLRQKGEL